MVSESDTRGRCGTVLSACPFLSQYTGFIMRATEGETVDTLYITLLIETKIAHLRDQFPWLSVGF